MSHFLEIATRNAGRGFRVHPLRPKDKLPLLAGWPEQATTYPAAIEQWAAQYPDANCGVAVGPDLCVLESDDLARLKELLGRVQIPATYTVQARDNRPHFYFRPTAKTLECGNRTLAGVFEFKQSRLQVVAEGSTHPCGATYRVIDDSPIIPLPDELMAVLVRLYLDGKAQETREAAPVEGGRNNYLTSVGGKLREAGLSEDALTPALLQHNDDVCQPPLSDDEVRQIAHSVARYPVPEPVGNVVIGGPKTVADWRTHYHTREETENAPKPEFLIKGFLQRQAIVGLAGFVGQKKSLIAQNVAYSLCSGEPLFGCFPVLRKPARVLYLCPEMALIGFANRITRIGLLPYVGETFFYATMSLQNGVIRLPELTKDESEGAVIVLDTAIRFIEGDENSSQHMKELAKQSFDLIRAGAEDVIVLAHSNKEMMKSSELTLDNAMRGSSELTAFLSSCWATRLQDPEHPYESASLLKHVKPRDFEADPFEVITDRETCRMTFVEGSRGASVAKKTNANADGKEETALDVIRDNPNLSLSKLVLKLKEMGITRSKSWVGEKRYEVHHTGVTTS